jgi:hypothetical protein
MTWGEITATASLTIALCALLFSAWQGYQTRRHNRLSVSPRLTTWIDSSENQGEHSVELMNNGIGPAVIKSFELAVDGKDIQGEQEEKIKNAVKIIFPTEKYTITAGYLGGGYVMAAKESRTLVSLKFLLGSMPSGEEFKKKLSRTSLKIKFESMYGESFELKTEGMESTHTKT